jgi:hypothetical protein
MDPWIEKKLGGRDVGSILVEELEFSVRAAHCLENQGIRTVADLATMTEAELMRIPNFGRRTLGEVKEILGALGVTLGEGRLLTPEQQLNRAMARARAAKVAYAEAMLEVQRVTQLIIETPLTEEQL